MKAGFIAAGATLLGSVAAHGGVESYKWGGKTYKGFSAYNDPSTQDTFQRQWSTYNPIEDPTLKTMACNDPGTAGKEVQTIAAGTEITAQWNDWPHNIGPVIVWMAECDDDCSGEIPSGKVWFKIDQAGLINGTVADGTWGSGQMIAQGSSWTSTIPKNLKPGHYLLRHETIALHTPNDPQFYMECAQMKVTGSGSASPPAASKAAIPGVYKMSDKNININVYGETSKKTWTVPGPNVWKGN